MLNQPDSKERLLAASPAGLVPVLVDPDGVTVWDSLAIIEWACEHAATPLWPQDPKARAIARSVSAEMHAGFYALRKHCPMNIRRINPARERDPAVLADVARIDEIWTDCRRRFGADGPFLFGAFSGADCHVCPGGHAHAHLFAAGIEGSGGLHGGDAGPSRFPGVGSRRA